MVGNVREWTSTRWGVDWEKSEFDYPWDDDYREDLTADKYVFRVYRGGGAADEVEDLRCSARGRYFPDKPGRWHGFRVVWLKV